MGLSLHRASASIVLSIAMCCAPSMSMARAEVVVPTTEELVQTIDAYHGACGHLSGEGVLSSVLLDLANGGLTNRHEFTSYHVECQTFGERQLTEIDMMFEWLGYFDAHQTDAWYLLEKHQQTKRPIPATVRRAALILLLGESPVWRDHYLPILRKDADAPEKRLAFQIAEGKYPDPFARGLGSELDVTGTYFRAIFAELGILPICQTCPAEPRGTEGEQMWARVFLTIHARNLPRAPERLLVHPVVAPWLTQYREGQTALQRAQAAVVLLRLLEILEHAPS